MLIPTRSDQLPHKAVQCKSCAILLVLAVLELLSNPRITKQCEDTLDLVGKGLCSPTLPKGDFITLKLGNAAGLWHLYKVPTMTSQVCQLADLKCCWGVTAALKRVTDEVSSRVKTKSATWICVMEKGHGKAVK